MTLLQQVLRPWVEHGEQWQPWRLDPQEQSTNWHCTIWQHREANQQWKEKQVQSHLGEQPGKNLEISQLKPQWRLLIQLNQPYLGHLQDSMRISSQIPWSNRDSFLKCLSLSTESFLAHQMIYKKINKEAAFKFSSSALSALIEARHRNSASSSYQLNLGDGKQTEKQNWLQELADTLVPLKLSENVPHGFKGRNLFSMLLEYIWSHSSSPTQLAFLICRIPKEISTILFTYDTHFPSPAKFASFFEINLPKSLDNSDQYK
ncbi:uncharacterized protein VP01_2549g1 [Puccinia sorghi]|uniref:Mediator complex subunit Med12 domain-containing protein n=1 Tax=Puccinia sorghi TaxID=27349 RepID=A0A0L6V547_9BASI|nr:uncharacterized protein VP01_2549g1 [Puccinia sorghi]